MTRARKDEGFDPFFRAEMRKLRCIACGAQPPSEAHHVRSRGAGGKDDFFNIIPLCKDDHTLGPNAWHRIGSISFLNKFPWVATYLIELGWYFDGKTLYYPNDRFQIEMQDG